MQIKNSKPEIKDSKDIREPTDMDWLNTVLQNLERNRQQHLAMIKQITLEKKIVFNLIRKEKRGS